MSDDPLDLLRRIVDSCRSTGVSYAVIGAMARNAWAPPRATTDVDVAVTVTPSQYAALLGELERRDIVLKRASAAEMHAPVPDLVLLEGPPGPLRRADLLVAKTDFEREAIEQSIEMDIGVQCRVVRPEHLVVYKLIAGRPRDLDDAAEVMRTRTLAQQPVDREVVRRWALEWGVEDRLDHLISTVESS